MSATKHEKEFFEQRPFWARMAEHDRNIFYRGYRLALREKRKEEAVNRCVDKIRQVSAALGITASEYAARVNSLTAQQIRDARADSPASPRRRP